MGDINISELFVFANVHTPYKNRFKDVVQHQLVLGILCLSDGRLDEITETDITVSTRKHRNVRLA